MASKKYYERLLIVAGIFLLFFVITIIGVQLLAQFRLIDQTTREGMLWLGVIQSLVLFIMPSLLAARIISPTPFSYLQLATPPSWMAILGVVFAYLIALPALNQIVFWNENISFPDSMAVWGERLREMEDAATNATNTMLDTTTVGGLVINLLVIGLVTALGEEMFFRGTLQHTAASSGAVHTSIWVVALLFSAMHFQIFGFIPRLLLGAWFGYLLFWTRSLYIPIFAHFLNNGIVVIFSWLSYRGWSYEFDKLGVVEYGFPIPAFISAVAFVIFLIYFRKLFFNNNLANRLSYYA